MARSTPSYVGLKPASERASRAARGSSAKQDTKCEVRLRSALFRAGCRFRKNAAWLPGKPDIVFTRAKVAVFVDGDFWHGRNWATRRKKLERGTNPGYWIRKIERNRERDCERTAALEQDGWIVIRVWETDVARDPEAIAAQVIKTLRKRDHFGKRG